MKNKINYPNNVFTIEQFFRFQTPLQLHTILTIYDHICIYTIDTSKTNKTTYLMCKKILITVRLVRIVIKVTSAMNSNTTNKTLEHFIPILYLANITLLCRFLNHATFELLLHIVYWFANFNSSISFHLLNFSDWSNHLFCFLFYEFLSFYFTS